MPEELTVADSQTHATCSSITVGPNVTVDTTGELDLAAPVIIFTDGVSVLEGGSLSAGSTG